MVVVLIVGTLLAAVLDSSVSRDDLLGVGALIQPWHLMVMGLVVTMLVAALQWSLSRRRAQAEQRATTATDRMHISDRSLRALAEHVPVGIMDLDVDGNVHWVNSRTLELVGESDTAAAAITDWLAFVHPEDRAHLASVYRDRFDDVGSVHLRHRIVTRDGHVRWIEQRGTPIVDKHGDLVRMVVSLHDISGLVEFEQQLTRARDGALEASNMKSEFLANMSHEIRTPLNGVIGMANLLLEGTLDAAQRSRIVTLRTAADQLLRLLNDILDLSKIESGRLELESTTFNPRDVIGDALRLHASGARDKGIGFTSEIDDALPAIVHGDPMRIRQVLDNLLSNAIKFTHDGEVRLVAAAERRKPQHATLRFEVHDTGVGISAHALETIFHPFTQADTSTTRRFGGTGLGLSICRQLAELMGGTLSVESTEREGSRFAFAVTLPVGRWERVSDASADDEADETATGDRLDSALRLLLVEDNVINQEVALGLLATKGWQIDVADNGVEGVDAVETSNANGAPYDAILMDCQMPEMDGYEATGQIRRLEGERRHTPIIALTAAVMKGDRERCLAAGMDDYVPKPVSVATLEAVLRRQLGGGAVRAASEPVETDDPEPPVIDWQILHDLAVVDGLLARSTERYLEYSPTELRALREAVTQRDFPQARAMAHKLKGASATLGMARLAAELSQIERACRHEPGSVDDLLTDIDDRFAEANEALSAAVARLDKDTAPAGDRG